GPQLPYSGLKGEAGPCRRFLKQKGDGLTGQNVSSGSNPRLFQLCREIQQPMDLFRREMAEGKKMAPLQLPGDLMLKPSFPLRHGPWSLPCPFPTAAKKGDARGASQASAVSSAGAWDSVFMLLL